MGTYAVIITPRSKVAGFEEATVFAHRIDMSRIRGRESRKMRWRAASGEEYEVARHGATAEETRSRGVPSGQLGEL